MLASRPNSVHYSAGTEAGPQGLSPSLAARTALALIRAYKLFVSPFFAGSCRYIPGCADYMSEALSTHGFMRGGWLGTRRLCRCHPFGGHGYDPVPPASDPVVTQALNTSGPQAIYPSRFKDS
jgi:putative membrane protein insertion efficiency factor